MFNLRLQEGIATRSGSTSSNLVHTLPRRVRIGFAQLVEADTRNRLDLKCYRENCGVTAGRFLGAACDTHWPK